MKNILILSIFTFLLIGVNSHLYSQDIPQYDYLEVIVIQKANNRGKIKRIKVEEQSSLEGKEITIDAIEDLEGTSDLLGYMNRAFLDRQSIVSEENDPVWMSYIFRKRK